MARSGRVAMRPTVAMAAAIVLGLAVLDVAAVGSPASAQPPPGTTAPGSETVDPTVEIGPSTAPPDGPGPSSTAPSFTGPPSTRPTAPGPSSQSPSTPAPSTPRPSTAPPTLPTVPSLPIPTSLPVPTVIPTPTTPVTGPGTVSVLALDSDTGQPVAGAVLHVDAADGVHTVTTPSSITVLSGEVAVTAVGAPDGYRYDGSVFRSGTVTPGKISAFTFQLSRKPTGLSSIRVVKRDRVTGDRLPDAAFVLSTCGGEYVDTVTTGVRGDVVHSDLAPGCYDVTESRAPDGYHRDAPPRRVTLPKASTVTVTAFDMPERYRVVRDPAHRVPVDSVPAGPSFG